MQKKLPISVIIITRNDAERVKQLAEKLNTLVREILILVDDRSEEGVLSSLKDVKKCRAVSHTFNGFGDAKQRAVSLAKEDWVFSLDSDESPSQALLEQLYSIDWQKPAIYAFHRLNNYRNKAVKGCGWYPDKVIRLFHKQVANFNDATVHESVKPLDSSTPIITIKEDILHYTYGSSLEALKKVLHYSSLYAQHSQKKAKPVPLIVLRAVFAFVKSYLLRRGFLYGSAGLFISILSATAVFNKHWALKEAVEDKVED